MFSRFGRFSRFIPMGVQAFGARTFSTATKLALNSTTSKVMNKKTLLTTGIITTSLINVINCADTVPVYGAPGTKQERTFIAIKPDGVQRGLVSEIIGRFEKKGYKLVGMKMINPTKAQAEEHYADLSSKPFFNGLVKYFTSGAVVCLVFEGKGVIKGGRVLVGATNPSDANPGSIRGDFCVDISRNLIHGSDGPESAKAEISMWFKDSEITQWNFITPVYE
ncbi:nucleoside diphosphate kinase [Tieghemostelium lacteum]|uniref:Nucleoside diphosphate kinase n=1 Tax=Tieghemostelium lacteum TaxID=361077 RepID=A0A152A7F9_TIELA|nr:nucleoside diphosphate kinase [Tieghemostelium lacteum]|eukprot:KYR02134.1 nucleoside diphosphate kinase [Tieghemostelium lacteum]